MARRRKRIAPAAPTLTLDGRDFVLIGAKKPHSAYRMGDSIRFELRPGERETTFDDASVERSQYDGYPTPAASHDQIIRVSYGLTLNGGAPSTAPWMYLSEWHHKPDPGEYSGSPPLAILFEGTTLKAIRRHTVQNPTVTPPASQTLWSKPGFMMQGLRYDIVEEVRFHQTAGFWRVWIDGVQVVDFTGQVGFPDTEMPYHMFGIYRSATPGLTSVVTYAPLPSYTTRTASEMG